MPTVLRWGRYRAFFYSNEGGEPPHVHIRAGNREAKIWLHELSDIIRELELHRDDLLDTWNEHFGT